MENEALVKEVLGKITRICSRSEQCSTDIRKKIIAEGIKEDVADEMIQSLTEENYLNDERYVKAYVADKFKFNKLFLIPFFTKSQSIIFISCGSLNCFE